MSSSGKMIFTGLKKEKPTEAPPIPKIPKRSALRLTNFAYLFLVAANIGLSGYMLTKAERRNKSRVNVQRSFDRQSPDKHVDNNAGDEEAVLR